MDIPEPLPTPEPPLTGDAAGSTPAAPIAASRGSSPTGRDWAWALSVSVVAAGLAWGIGETGRLHARPADAATSMMGFPSVGPTSETRRVAAIKTAGRFYTTFGALLGLGLGLAGGLARGLPRQAGVAAAVGAPATAVMGALASMVVLNVFPRIAGDHIGELLPALVMHALMWLPLAAAAGLAFGLGRRGSSGLVGAALGAMAGALAGTVLYELIGAFAFPLAETSEPVSATGVTRLLAFLLLAVPISIGALLGLREPRPTAKA